MHTTYGSGSLLQSGLFENRRRVLDMEGDRRSIKGMIGQEFEKIDHGSLKRITHYKQSDRCNPQMLPLVEYSQDSTYFALDLKPKL